MTAAGWIEIALYLVILTALTPVLGAYMARVYRFEPVFLDRVIGPVERLSYRAIGVDPNRGQDWKAYAKSTLVFSAVSWGLLYLILRTQGIHPFNPLGPGLGHLGSLLQHNLLLRHQHELAVLRRRDDALLLLADGGPGGAELRLRSRRHGRRDRRHPGTGIALRPRDRLVLPGRDPHGPVHPAADLDRRGPLPGLPGRDPEPRRGRRPRRLAGRHQATRHERRRLLQRQLRPSVGEPHVAFGLRRGPDDPPHPRGADVHLRADGRQPPPGLGALRGDDGPAHRRDRRRRDRRVEPDARDARGRDHRRQLRGQGAALRHPLDCAVGGGHDRGVQRRRSTARWNRSPASAASFRWPTCRPAR